MISSNKGRARAHRDWGVGGHLIKKMLESHYLVARNKVGLKESRDHVGMIVTRHGLRCQTPSRELLTEVLLCARSTCEGPRAGSGTRKRWRDLNGVGTEAEKV